MKHRRTAALFAALFLAAGTARAQEGQEGEEAPLPAPPLPLPQLGGGDDPVEELKQLFLDVERKLRQIDIDLADAGAGEVPLDGVEDAGIDALLQRSRQRSLEAQLEIDRILEIARQMGQSGSGSGKGKPQPGGDSPLDQQRDTGPQQRENTPDAPRERPGGDEQHEEGDPQDGQEPKDGKEPKDGPGENPSDGRNTEGDPRTDEGGPQTPHGNEADEWGFLPDRFRETFRNQGRDDLPVQYRDWIDTYYRRLNRSDR
jgi:hypothetical protein